MANFATQLATITTANGYSMSVDSPVLRDVPHSEKLTQEIDKAKIIVEDSGEDSPVSWFETNKGTTEITVNVRCYVRSARDEEPTDEIGSIQADVMKLVDSPISLGANAMFAYVKKIENVVMAERLAIVEIAVGVLYWYTRSAP